MKNLLIAFFLIISINVFAQSFEGTIKWSWETEITDPVAKAQMDEAQKMMKDPEKIKEMEKQLADPQMQQMLAQNPQMKAQMEKMLEMMKSGGETSIMPTGMTVQIKNGNSLSKVEGSFIDSEFLFLKEKNHSYMIDHKNKTYSPIDLTEDGKDETPDVKVTKTGETQKILNYNCVKYEVEYTIDGKPTKQYIWATKDIKGLDFSDMAKQQMGNNKRMMFFKEIQGVPLKMEMNWPEGKMTMQATQVKSESLPTASFLVPTDYKEVKMGF